MSSTSGTKTLVVVGYNIELTVDLTTWFRSKESYRKWQEDPVLTTVITSAYPIGNVTFPTFTICSFGLIEDVLGVGIAKQFLAFLELKKNISHGLNPYQILKNVSFKITLFFHFHVAQFFARLVFSVYFKFFCKIFCQFYINKVCVCMWEREPLQEKYSALYMNKCKNKIFFSTK